MLYYSRLDQNSLFQLLKRRPNERNIGYNNVGSSVASNVAFVWPPLSLSYLGIAPIWNIYFAFVHNRLFESVARSCMQQKQPSSRNGSEAGD